MSVKTTKIIDLNLFSGSSEDLRNHGGAFYNDAVGNGDINFFNFLSDPMKPVEFIESSEPYRITDKIIPRIRYANRMYGNEKVSILSDEDWKTIIIGGTYADKTYKGIYNDAVYADHANNSSLPYVPREIVNVEDKSPSLSLTTEYYNYYERYQLEVGNQESELTIPNYYLLDGDLFAPTTDTNSCIAETTYPDMEEYLTNDYVNNGIALNTSLENIFVLNPQESSFSSNNALVVRNTAKPNDLLTGYVDSDLQKLYSIMPFGNKLRIEEELANTSRDFRNIIEANRYQTKLLKLLKEVFQQESRLQTTTVNFAVNTEAVGSTGVLTGSLETTSTVPVKLVDAPTMLLYAYKNPSSETNNISVLPDSVSYESQISQSLGQAGVYRFQNTRDTLNVLNDFVNLMGQKFDTTKDGGITHPLKDFYDQAGQNKYYETVAFRIQKIGGSPTGDSRTENTIQNIWFYNKNKAFEYFDTQVKYDTEYTYKVYKYDLVQGYKYQISDLVVSNQIDIDTSGPEDIFCLEFRDPITNARARKLFENSRGDSFVYSPRVRGILSNLISRRLRLLSLKNKLLQARSRLNDFRTLLDSSNAAALQNEININYPSTGLPYFFKETTTDNNDLTENFVFYDVISGSALISQIGAGLIDPEQVTYFDGINYPPRTVPRGEALTYRRAIGNNDSEGYRNIVSSSLEPVESELLPYTSLFANIESNTILPEDSIINSTSPYLADFNITIEPSLKIIEIPLEEKRMRIVDHPPNDFTVTAHHLLDQTNRLSFYCKYDTFSMNTVTYPSSLTALDTQNKSAYLEGHDFVEVSELTQESVSRPRFIEVYRTTTKPTSYEDFTGQLRKTIDLRDSNGDVATDELFTERVRENIVYYYMFRSLNENRVAGQMSPVIEAELINDGGYVYARFEQYTEDDLEVPEPKEPIIQVKKLFNIIPNIQHLELNTENVDFSDSSVNQAGNIILGDSDLEDPLFTSDVDRYFKIRLTSKKTGRKIDINVGFKKEVRK